jgi:regulator of protease activity HflC (stomatin/prohibitin superfamily)
MSVRELARQAVEDVVGAGDADGFRIDPQDFLSARELGAAVSTRITQRTAALSDAAEIVNRSFPEADSGGRFTNVISPLLIPDRRFGLWPLPVGLIALLGLIASVVAALSGVLEGPASRLLALLGPHFWLLLLIVAIIGWYRRSIVMVPDGCQALITRFGKLEQIVGAGRTTLLSPWKRVSYIVNTTREYPYNAPIREAPTASGVSASVDLFLQFRIEDPAEFVFSLGGVKGFSDKLQNAISEVTRALIFGQRAEAIYDLVGENSQGFLEALNQQFLPAVRFVNANITHAEPSNREYRMDLAAPEMVRVAKEAYTYQYELGLRKQQNEGELNKDLASLRETLSAISAEIAASQAQMDTARERETNRATAYARQRLAEARSTANANAALLEAQALDIRAVSGATAPELLEHRFRQEVLERLGEVAGRLPQVVQLGGQGDGADEINFLAIARSMVGADDGQLYSPEDLLAIRERLTETQGRIRERAAEIERAMTATRNTPGGARPEPPRDPTASPAATLMVVASPRTSAAPAASPSGEPRPAGDPQPFTETTTTQAANADGRAGDEGDRS